jgi:hypothetical protein
VVTWAGSALESDRSTGSGFPAIVGGFFEQPARAITKVNSALANHFRMIVILPTIPSSKRRAKAKKTAC